MFESVQYNQSDNESAVTLDMAPLIDMIFILLIFFLVTTTFVNETGITVTRPEASTADSLEPRSLRISIAASGAIYINGRLLNLEQCRDAVNRFINQDRNGGVIIIPDEEVTAKQLVAVMDAAKQGGAEKIAVATRRKSQRGTNS